jgi:uncharacterized protein (TIGR02594 family)
MKEPKYLSLARSHLGLKELTGNNDHPLILSAWVKLNAKWLYKEAWCGLGVGYCLDAYDYAIPKEFYRAKEWLEWGERLDKPCLGCVVILDRPGGGGHVGFPIGFDYAGRLRVIGANQNNQVSVATFDTKRVLGYRMPFGVPTRTLLPIVSNADAVSENEA